MLHALSLGVWIGPWDTHAGAMASKGLRVLALGRISVPEGIWHLAGPAHEAVAAWLASNEKAPPQRDEA